MSTRRVSMLISMLILISSLSFSIFEEDDGIFLDDIEEEIDDADFPENWWATVQGDIIKSEYAVTWQEETYLQDVSKVYQAPNRANNLRTYFPPSGIVIIPREGIEPGELPRWRWEMSLAAWGRDRGMIQAPNAALETKENRIYYHRPNFPLEIYTNTEDGLKQELILDKAPDHNPPGQPIQLVFALGGDLVARIDNGESQIILSSTTSEDVLNFGSLLVSDAEGKTLSTWMSLEGSKLSFWVDDREAVYPILISSSLRSLTTSWVWNINFGQEAAQFGFSLAAAGDVDADGYSDVIVGAPYYDGGFEDEGAAFVYHGYPEGLYPAPDWLKLSNQAGARFGWSVSTAGDVDGDGDAEVIVGAPYWHDGQSNEGAAWVYYGSGSGLNSAPGEYYQGNQVGAGFGSAVSYAGDVNGDGYGDIIVGAPLRALPESEEGIASVFYGSEGGLSNSVDWLAQSNQVDGSLGCDVSTAGDINGDGFADIIIGASRYTAGQEWEGAAFIWLGAADGLNHGIDGDPSNAHRHLQIDSGWARFGWSVSTAGDVNGDGFADVIVGAPYYTNGQANEGGAWLYLGGSSGLNLSESNKDEGNQANANFGYSVGTAGDVNGDGRADVIVGAPGYTSSQTEQGRAWVWYGQDTSNGISTTRDWDTAGQSANDNFGASVFTAGDINGDGYSDVIIGAPGADSDSGAAYVFCGGADTPGETAGWVKRSNLANALFGSSVGSAGDVNGDGYDDVIVGAPRWDGGFVAEGSAWVYLGNADGLNSSPHFYRKSGLAYAEFGKSVGTAGDVNGDGYSDVIIGAPSWSNPQINEGAAFVYPGSPSGLNQSAPPLWSKASDQAGADFGTSVGTAGDVNGDGYGDIIIGAPSWESGSQTLGGVWLYYGSDSGPHSAPDWYKVGDQEDALYGFAVSTAGDVNRDGYSDVIIGAPYWEDDVVSEGRVWLHLGSRVGLHSESSWHAEANNFNAQMGYSVDTAGDVDGDGFADVIVGAPYFGDGGLNNEGKVYVFYGTSSGLTTSYWSRESGQNGAYYGYSVGTAGDVNGDGYADVIIGAPLMNSTLADEGTTRIYLGSAVGLKTTYDWFGEGGQILSWYGQSVGSAGDVNGDGYADVVVGAPEWQSDLAYVDEGRALVYYGNGGPGVSLRPRQTQIDGTPLAHLGMTDESASLRIYTLVGTPFGRGGLQQMFEIKQLGESLDGDHAFWWGFYENPAIGSDRYVPSGTLSAGVPYHWRVRLCYDPATTPWMPCSRWVTNPWNGWNEQDFRTYGSQIFLPVILR